MGVPQIHSPLGKTIDISVLKPMVLKIPGFKKPPNITKYFQCGAPKIAKLPNIISITIWFMIHINLNNYSK